MKLQKEVDRLEDEWAHEKDKYKAITDEMVRLIFSLAGSSIGSVNCW